MAIKISIFFLVSTPSGGGHSIDIFENCSKEALIKCVCGGSFCRLRAEGTLLQLFGSLLQPRLRSRKVRANHTARYRVMEAPAEEPRQ